MKTWTTILGLLSSSIVLRTNGLAIPEPEPEGDLATRQSCALPSTYRWTDAGGPLAQPRNGWVSLKDFTVSTYNGQYIVYGSNFAGSSYGSFGKLATSRAGYVS